MSTSVYKINKRINQSLVFKGLKAQYIWWLGGGIMVLMFVFSILYIVGINAFICVALILIAGLYLFMQVYKISNKYGEHCMLKKMAKKGIPSCIKSYSRKHFADLRR
jgi:xanthosine utilization system XapX-like protein